ncbi:MAG: hypothetical protein ACRCR3_02280 [Tannerellaceae bacterium]
MIDNVNQNGKYKPHVLVLGSNFGGLTAACLIREEAKETIDITVIDRKPYLLFVPNIPLEVFGYYYAMKMGFKEMYYQTGGKPPGWGIKLTEIMGG